MQYITTPIPPRTSSPTSAMHSIVPCLRAPAKTGWLGGDPEEHQRGDSSARRSAGHKVKQQHAKDDDGISCHQW